MGNGWLERAARTVTSKVDDVWDRGVEVARGPVGGVRAVGDALGDLASAPFTKDEYDGFLGTLYNIAVNRGGQALGAVVGPKTGVGALVGGLPEVARRPARDVIQPVLGASETVYREGISEPLSTAMTLGSIADSRTGGHGFASFLNADDWRQAYKIAQNRSPGQAIAIAIGTKDVLDPKEVERFAATDNYRMWSGVGDAVIRLGLDPSVVGGKGLSAAREGLRAVPLTQEGIAAARDSTRVAKFVERVDNIIKEYPDSAAARIRTELFPDHAEGSYLSDLLKNAPDTVTRRRIVGAAMGSSDDYVALSVEAPNIAHQIRKLNADALDVWQTERGMLGPGRLEMIDTELQSLYPEADRLTKLEEVRGTLREIPNASALARVRAGVSTSDFYQRSPLAAPLRTVTNMMPQHWLNLNDQRGDIQVSRMLQQTDLPQEEQLALRSNYMSQVGPAARQRAALDIEARVVQRTLDKYDVPKWVVDDVLANAPRLREGATGALSRRLYDAAGRGSVLVGQEDGTFARLHLPLHVTQQADLLPLVDPAELERAAQAVKGWDWESGAWNSVRNKYRATRLGVSGTDTAKLIAGASNAPAEALEMFYSLWRPATLLRVGWPARILGDEQLRILSKIGAMTHFGDLGKAAAGNLRQRLTPWEFLDDNGELITGRGLPKFEKATPQQVANGIVRRGIGDYETSLKLRSGEEITLPPAYGTPGDAENVFRRLNSSSGTFRDLAVPSEDGLLRTFRQHTGTWKSIDPRSSDYRGVWEQAVNRQLKQSAFARQALEGKDVGQMVAWLANTDEGVAYARQMGWSPQTFERHAADVADQVNRYVPTEKLRSVLLERDLKHADLVRAVPDELARPAVHGEDLAQALGSSDITKLAKNVIAGAWKWMGQMPTDILSRNPFFDQMYRMEAERLATVASDDAARAGRTLTAEEVARIASSSRRFALNESQKLLYDLGEKSKFAYALRFVAPFYMAWQEVLTRWAGIAVDNPAFVARMRLAWNSPEKAGLVTDENGYRIDENGDGFDPISGKKVNKTLVGSTRFVTVPFPIPGLPTGGDVKFNKKSLNMALGGMPGLGPPVQIPVNEIVKNKPDLETSVRFVLPFGAQQSTLSLVMPATAKRAFALAQKNDDRQYANTVLRIYFDRVTDWKLGKRKIEPTYGEAKKAANQLYALRTVASYVSPVSPVFSSPYQPFIDAYRNAQERLRKNPAAFGTQEDGSPVSVDEWFLDNYGEEYFWLTQSLSKSNDGVTPTAEGFDARKRYQDLIEKHPDLGGLIIGNEGAGDFSNSVYQSQLAHDTAPGSGVRQRGVYSFAEGSVQPEVRLGWIRYGQIMDALDVERVKRGLPNLQVKAAGDLALVKKAATEALKEKYPAWAGEFAKNDNTKWPTRIAALRDIADDKRLKNRTDRPDILGLRAYLQVRDAFTTTLAQRKAKTLTAASNQDLAFAWDTAKAAIVEKYVGFAPIFYRYLERDPLVEG